MSANTYSHLPEVLSTLLVAGSLLISTAANAAQNEDTLFDFSTTDQMDAWRIVNDGVMGGLSQKGDGRNYQLRLRTDNRFDGASYRAEFPTQQGKWTVIDMPFAEMVPTFRGRVLAGYPAVDPTQIQQLGFLISNKVAEPFRLEVDWIKAYSK